MYQDLDIWSPVIVARLESARSYQPRSSYLLDANYKRIEDIKVRIKSSQANFRGKSVESQVDVELLCLLEDYQGLSRPLIREEILKEQVPLQEFEPIPDQPQEIRYIQNIIDFAWDADIKGSYLELSYDLTYNLLATREQVVQIQAAPAENQVLNNVGLIPPVQDEQVEKITEENHKLRKQMYFYERDLGSLKRGIQKAENNNNSLNRELSSYKDMVAELKEAIKRKDHMICSFENGLADIPIFPTLPLPEASLGKRIKKMFLNNQ